MKKFFSATVTATPATPQPQRNGYPQIFVAVQVDIPAAANDSDEPPPKTPTLARRVLGSVSQFAGIVIAGVATVALVVSHHPTQAPPAKPPVAQNDNSGKRPPAKPPAAHNDNNSNKSEYLRKERARFDAELKNNPALKRELADLIVHENLGARTGVVEALFNRQAMTGGTVAQGMHNGFYGPINRGEVHWTGSAADWQAMRYIDEALAGSNLIQGYTDQGSRGDPNYERGGVGININGERFNDWGGAGSHSTKWRLEQQRHVREGGGAKVLPMRSPTGISGAGHANFMKGVFTVHQGRRYHATLSLRGFEQWATNEMIADRLRRFGFTEIKVNGSGAIREAQARWAGPDTTSPIDEHLTNVFELTDAAGRGT